MGGRRPRGRTVDEGGDDGSEGDGEDTGALWGAPEASEDAVEAKAGRLSDDGLLDDEREDVADPAEETEGDAEAETGGKR